MRSVRPGGKYRSIRHTKISEIQTGIFGRMERAPRVTATPSFLACVASVPERRERNKRFSHSGREKNGARAKMWKERGGGGERS